jgi:hypothetical protein
VTDRDVNPRWLALLATVVPVAAAVALGWHLRQAQVSAPPPAPVVRAGAADTPEPPSTP